MNRVLQITAAIVAIAASGTVVRAATQTYYFPHLAVGGGWQTTFTFVNYSRQSVTCQTTFYSDSGGPLQVPFSSGSVASRTDTLASGADLHVESRAASDAGFVTGWAKATCSGPVKASLLYRLYNSAGAQGEAGVNATTAPATEFVSYAQTLTGLAWANPSSSATATLTITALDAKGARLAVKTETVEPGHHGQGNIGPLLGVSNFTGSVQVTSTAPIVAVLLNAEAFPVVSSLPPAELPDGTALAGGSSSAAGGATTYYFPHFTFGDNWQTILTLVNYSPNAVSCQTRFYSDSGGALQVPFADGTVSARTDNLAAGASIHVITAANTSAAATSGWAQADCTAPVKASLLYRYYNNGVAQGEAGVNATTTPATEFASFAETRTGLAFANPTLSGSAAKITVTGYDTAGKKAATYSTTLQPGAHAAANIAPLFGLKTFNGWVAITSTSPIIAVFINAEAFPVFSSLPPADLPSGTLGSGQASTDVISEHVLAQTGLAIGLASTVLQSQLHMLVAVLTDDQACTGLDGGGSVGGNGSTVTVYYDNNCTKPYVSAQPSTSGTSTVSVSETATYYGLDGSVIGSLALSETAAIGTSGATLNGLGVFTPASGAQTPVQLGLYCTFSTNTQNAPCGGGIAQDFPALGVAIGAVTPLTLHLSGTTFSSPVTFDGGGSPVTGPLGSLTLTNPVATSLVIEGGTTFTSITAQGGAAGFELFPPTPTGWTLTDTTHDQKLDIEVVDNTARNLSVTITRASSGEVLATGALDQSGTGSITYSDGTTSAVTSWTLAK